MRRRLLALAQAVLLLAAGCSAPTSEGAPATPPVRTPSALPSRTPGATPAPPPSTPAPGRPAATPSQPIDGLYEKPLRELSVGADDYLRARRSTIGVAVLVPERHAIYTYHGDVRLPVASIIKLVILMATIDRAERAGRALTYWERESLEPMIIWSDNDSADELWWDLGGAPALTDYLKRIGVDGIVPDPEGYWGDSKAAPKALAYLLGKVLWGNVLSPEGRAYVLKLLGSVESDQRWGMVDPRVGAASNPGDWLVGLKNGWYPDEDGWEVNTTGYVVPLKGTGAYTLSVLSSGQDTFEQGVEELNTVARFIHASVRPQSTPNTTSR